MARADSRWVVVLLAVLSAALPAAEGTSSARPAEPTDGPVLRLAAQLDVRPTLDDQERELLRREYRVAQAGSEQTVMLDVLFERIRSNQATVAELRSALEAGGTRPVGAAHTPTEIAVAATTESGASPTRDPRGWLIALGVTGIALAGLVFRRRRRLQRLRTDEQADEQADERATGRAARVVLRPAPAAENAVVVRRVATPAPFEAVAPGTGPAVVAEVVPQPEEVTASIVGALESQPVVTDSSAGAPAETNPDASAEVWSAFDGADGDAAAIIDLAEIFLRHGSLASAIVALRDYVADNPSASVRPWLKLLAIHHEAGMREAFEETAKSVHRHFNVRVPSWDEGVSGEPLRSFAEDGNAEATPAGLEQLPRVLGNVQASWGYVECLKYIRHLLADNRNGGRTGFPLAVVTDLLFLQDILESRLSGTV